uniref:Amino acid transporter n=1 Tax=Riptortus pedestris TaxID=329032 RepID=R4WJA1_RIPPE|nr:amino acid transporter [Riptortus pedestris]
MGTHTANVITLANSIIGVSVLAMPFCFKQCGIILSVLMLLFSNIITRLACHYLMKSAIMEKRKNFEMLAFRAFGPTGKLIVELCIIGFMLGTCVAYFVIMGDLGPGIIGPMFGVEHPIALRPSVLIGIAVFVVLPLGLLKNIDSLSAVCAATVAFYFCLVLKVVMGEALNHLIVLDWMDKVYYWKPSGILQCIPIFSMALFCQTQLFEIFDSLPSTPLDRMNGVVGSALNMVTLFYISVGFFGYVAYCDQTFTGNLMMNFSPTIVSDVIKIGFLLSVAVSFPLVIFPCRASIYSLFFSKGYEHAQTGSAHIPESRFQCITIVIVTASLVIGLLIPNIEVVLGLVGSTIGVFICVIIPAVIFISLSVKKNNERLVAKFLVGIGLVIMVLGTYANLYATEEAVSGPEIRPMKKDGVPIPPNNLPGVGAILKDLNNVKEFAALPELKPEEIHNKNPPIKKDIVQLDDGKKIRNEKLENPLEVKIIKVGKKEPPVPEEPQDKPVAQLEDNKNVELSLVQNNAKNDDIKPQVKQGLKEELPKIENLLVVNTLEKEPHVKKNNDLDKEKYKMNSNNEKLLESENVLKDRKLPVLKNENDTPSIDKVKGINLVPGIQENNKTNIASDKLKENLIEKIKEHEEAQKKLNEEGIKLLKELKDVVKNENNSLKLVNVKTGVVYNLNTSQLVKPKLEEKVQTENRSMETNILTQKIAQGIPLPLAIKNQSKISVEKEKDTNKKSENEIIEKAPIGRDILEDAKQIREKRDLDDVLKLDSLPTERNEKSGFESQPKASIVKIGKDLEYGEPVKEVHNETESENTLAMLKENLKNCKKNETNVTPQKSNIEKNEKNMDELIKSPFYLSDVKSVLNDSPRLLGDEAGKSNIPEMPKKRDLKSLSSENLVEGKTANS